MYANPIIINPDRFMTQKALLEAVDRRFRGFNRQRGEFNTQRVEKLADGPRICSFCIAGKHLSGCGCRCAVINHR